jgi:hypothetical protein
MINASRVESGDVANQGAANPTIPKIETHASKRANQGSRRDVAAAPTAAAPNPIDPYCAASNNQGEASSTVDWYPGMTNTAESNGKPGARAARKPASADGNLMAKHTRGTKSAHATQHLQQGQRRDDDALRRKPVDDAKDLATYEEIPNQSVPPGHGVEGSFDVRSTGVLIHE